MKTLSTASVLLFAYSFLGAQVALEHTYPSGSLKRITIDATGEHYLLEQSYCRAALYNAQHGLRADFEFTWGESCGDYFFSEALIDSDPELEIFFSWADFSVGGAQGDILQDDNGQVLLYDAQPSQIKGLPLKFIRGSRTVLKVPDFSVEYTYPHPVSREKLPLWGETYFYYNNSDQPGWHFYDSTHQFVRYVPLTEPYAYITQTHFDDDADPEFFVLNWAPEDANGNRRLFQIFEQDGQVKFQRYCEGIAGITGQLVLLGYDQPDHFTSWIIDAHTFETQHQFPSWVRLVKPPTVTNHRFVVSNENNDTTWIYSPDFELEAMIPLPPGMPGGHNWNMQFNYGRFTTPERWEVIYTTSTSASTQATKVVCTDATGILHLEFPLAQSGSLSSFEGSADKLLVHYADSNQVYAVEKLSTHSTEPPPASVIEAFPNPFSDKVTLKRLLPGLCFFQLTDLSGRVVWSKETDLAPGQDSYALPLNSLYPGTYFLTIRHATGTYPVKITKSKP